jgi:tRNA(fMet)-specific endonuclease VapC
VLNQRIDQLLASIEVAALDSGVDEHYGRIRAELEAHGTPIGGNDLLIAAHALAEQATLVTDNTGEFRRVPGLRVENWLRPD